MTLCQAENFEDPSIRMILFINSVNFTTDSIVWGVLEITIQTSVSDYYSL